MMTRTQKNFFLSSLFGLINRLAAQEASPNTKTFADEQLDGMGDRIQGLHPITAVHYP